MSLKPLDDLMVYDRFRARACHRRRAPARNLRRPS